MKNTRIDFTCPVCNITIKIKKYRENKVTACSKPCLYKLRKEQYKGENNPFFGKHHSIESIELIKTADRSFTQTQEYKEKIGLISKSKGCGGSTYLEIWKKQGEEYFREKLEAKKNKHRISALGKNNPMYGKPSPSKSGTGWKGWYKGWYFRSVRELSFMINVIEKYNFIWETAENKKYRIEYKHYNGSDRTYRADFILNNKYMVEIKPTRLINTPLVSIKTNAAIKFCENNGLMFVITDINIDYKQIHKLYQDKLVVFDTKSEKLFKEYKCRN